jgi:two-component system, OmpR family, sensor histidine kinase QseC
MKSLSRLLLVLLLGVLTLGGLVSGWAAYRAGRIEADELFDAKLAHSARVLRGLVDAALADDSGEHAPLRIDVWSGTAEGEGDRLATDSGHAYETKLAFQVWLPDGRLLLASANAPAQPLAPLHEGFADTRIDGEHWRSFVLRSAGGRWYVAGEREDVRADIAGDIAAGILWPLAVELPVVALLVVLVIRYGEVALRRVTREVEGRAVDHLRPLDASVVPDEIRGLVLALNRLLGELDGALQRERRFTADAAHELRTPLAALRVHLDNLAAAPDAATRAQAQRSLQRGLDRLQRLVEQLLALSRLEPGAAVPARQPVALRPLLGEVVAGLVDAGLAEGVDLAVDGEAPAVPGDPLALAVLLRNLLDNALRYTPRPGQVLATLHDAGEAVELVVEDSGPGIPAERRERVLERFHRELGTGTEGSGLGLSIAQRVVALHGGSMRLDESRWGGLLVRVRLPKAG